MKKLLPLKKSILVFLHIKKTGGISLQKNIQEKYPKNFYGSDHVLLRNKIKITKSDIESIPNGSAIANHWKYEDFDKIKDRCNFVTIVRNPIERIASAYNFFLYHHGRTKSFSQYINDESNINLLSKSIVSKDFMTEIYLFNKLRKSVNNSKILLNTKPVGHFNKTRYRYRPRREDLSEFIKLNDKDIKLYDLIVS